MLERRNEWTLATSFDLENKGTLPWRHFNGTQVDELVRKAVVQRLLMEALPMLNELYQEAERETRWRQMVGERIRRLREARDWSQEQLAVKSKTRRDIVDTSNAGGPTTMTCAVRTATSGAC